MKVFGFRDWLKRPRNSQVGVENQTDKKLSFLFQTNINEEEKATREDSVLNMLQDCTVPKIKTFSARSLRALTKGKMRTKSTKPGNSLPKKSTIFCFEFSSWWLCQSIVFSFSTLLITTGTKGKNPYKSEKRVFFETFYTPLVMSKLWYAHPKKSLLLGVYLHIKLKYNLFVHPEKLFWTKAGSLFFSCWPTRGQG